MKKAHVTVLILVLLAIAASLMLRQVYVVIDQADKTVGSVDELTAEIGTPGKRLLNGYLGMFFRFKELGNINWLLFPLALWFFITAKKRERFHLALLFVYIGSSLLIGYKGYYNSRYQMTLLPFTVTAILLLMWELLKDYNRYLKTACFMLIGVLALYNIYHYSDNFKFFIDIKTEPEKRHFPDKMLAYLNSPERDTGDTGVFVIDSPILHYYTNRKGHDTRDVNIYHITRMISRKGQGKRTAIFNSFKLSNIKYLLLTKFDLKTHRSKMLEEFVQCESELIRNAHGYCLYRMRDTALDFFGQKEGVAHIPVWQKRKKNPKRMAPLLRRFSYKGTFEFEVKRKKKVGRHMVVRNTAMDKEGRQVMNLGFEMNRRKLDIDIPVGKTVYFAVEAAAVSHVEGAAAQVRLQQPACLGSEPGCGRKGAGQRDSVGER
ncbi:MAG: hypothetical protein GY765_27765, partial [bacterium]|nr:hypothetical protein [bacterium]